MATTLLVNEVAVPETEQIVAAEIDVQMLFEEARRRKRRRRITGGAIAAAAILVGCILLAVVGSGGVGGPPTAPIAHGTTGSGAVARPSPPTRLGAGATGANSCSQYNASAASSPSKNVVSLIPCYKIETPSVSDPAGTP